jgi:glycosyltransferase involved in cell wall biosynthesis
MKVALLSSLSSIHTTRWANIFAEKGHDVYVITCHARGNDSLSPRIKVYQLPYQSPLGYYLNTCALQKILKEIKPDILNAHYASGYGTLARLCSFHPYVLSVWGSDVYDFPYKSFFHKYILKKNLLAADIVCSTSHVMSAQTKKVCPQLEEIPITPFGVDTNIFKPMPQFIDSQYITIGTVKTLAPKYGIDTLLKAFACAKNTIKKVDIETSSRLRLLIVGGGPQKKELNDLAQNLGINEQCIWAGQIPHAEVPRYLNQLDIYVALSKLESFGVAIIEASACGIPVVVSNVGGLPEVVKNKETGLIVEKDNPQQAANALIEFICNPHLRHKIGKKGREYVKNTYEWDKCAATMEKIYKKIISPSNP